jgi:hypothetical protein
MIKPVQNRYLKNREYYRKRLECVLLHLKMDGLRVLDLGCGECLLSEYPVFTKLRSYTGVDELDYPNRIPYIRQNVLDFLKTDQGIYDLILCLGLVDHLDDASFASLLTELRKRSETGWAVSIAQEKNPVINFLKPSKRTIQMREAFGKPDLVLNFLKLPLSSALIDLTGWPAIFSTETVWIRHART